MNVKEIIDAERWSQQMRDGWWEVSHNSSLNRIEASVTEYIKNLEAQVAAFTSKTAAVKYGCHADLNPGTEPDDCVISRNDFEDCIFAKPGMKPENCEYWKPVEEKK